ncbi:MAG: DMT family transporter [Deltaproteobacteria bacterium]|nr:DMT family transporter [Deltaproteobacteria bacterium]
MPTITNNRLFLISIFIAVGSSNPIAIKYAINVGWPPFALGMLRMAFIGIVFTFWVISRGEGLIGPNREARKYVLIAASCKAVGVILFYVALWLIPANRAVMLSTISPVVSLVLIHFILEHENVRSHHVAGIVTSLAGMVLLLILRNGFDGGNLSSHLTGDFLMLVSVVFNNAMVVFEKKALIHGANPRQLLVSTNFLSVIVFALFFCLSAESLLAVPLTGKSVGAYLYLVTVVGIFLFYYRRWLVSKLDVSYMSSFSHAGKALSILYASLLLGETVSITSLAAFILILWGTRIATGNKK